MANKNFAVFGLGRFGKSAALTLEQMGYNVLGVDRDEAIAASLMATMLCKEAGVPEIVVKAIDERHAEMAKRLGATKIVFSERDMARRVALQLVSDNAVDYMEIDANIKVLSLPAPKNLIGKNLIQANLRAAFDVNIIAITRAGETTVTPPPSHVFAAGDKIFVIGTPAALAKFERSII